MISKAEFERLAAASDLTAYELSPYLFARLQANSGTPPPYDPARGNFTLGSTGSLDTSGLIVDDRVTSSTAQTLPLATRGGSIAIESYNVDLASGSDINASGGVAVNALNVASYGDGGSISILAGKDPNAAVIFGGYLNLGGTLEAFSGAKAGSLTLQAPLVQIGGVASEPNTLLLTPEFFNTGGFGSFAINGLGAATGEVDHYTPGVLIAAGTQIAPIVQSWLTETSDPNQPIELTPTVLSEGIRTPVSLSLNALGVVDIFHSNLLVVRGDLLMEENSSIVTDGLGSVSLKGNTAAVLGSIFTPGGRITISGSNNSAPLFSDQQHALPTVDIGPDALLWAAGETLLTPDARGFRIGSVLAGGTITLSGNIVAESGAVLNVSGTNGLLDLAPALSGRILSLSGSFAGAPLLRTRVESDGGTINLNGGQELFCDATLIGNSGGASALGGTLNVSSGRFYVPGSVSATPLDWTMQVTQSGSTFLKMFYPDGETAIGHVVVGPDGGIAQGLGHFTADSFNNSGFGALTLSGVVQFSGEVTLNATRAISVASGGIIYGDAAINLNAPYVALGTAFQPPLQSDHILSPFFNGTEPFHFDPKYGSGVLNVNAQLIDIGNLSLQNIGTANLIARGGDVRGDGTFEVAGNINITAAQVYPPTETIFTIAAYDYQLDDLMMPGAVTFTGSGERPLPLSAGGTLNVYASTINQGGVLRAPIGTINLGWDGSGEGPIDPITNAAFPVAQQVNLTSGSVTSVSAIDPITGQP